MGCFGCGCAIVIAFILLIVALVGAVFYYAYSKGYDMTSTTPADVPAFNGSDDLFRATQQKLAAFQHDMKANQPATLHLSADEINSLIDHSPQLAANKSHAFVSITGDEARLQASFQTKGLPFGVYEGRYANVDTTFGVDFDHDEKTLTILLHTLTIGNYVAPDSAMPAAQVWLDTFLNMGLRKDPDSSKLLDAAKSIHVKAGELVIETQ